MNVTGFLKHWGVRENPFLAEEARQDDILTRLAGRTHHPDFSKVLGDPARPASAVVFGEKGSGKTALRLQLEEEIRSHNAAHPDNKSLIVAYDELNPVLDRFARSVRGKNPRETLDQLRLVDHIDGILSVAVPDLVDAVLGDISEGHVDLNVDPRSAFRRLDPALRRDWVILQALYDRPELAVSRGRALRRAVRHRAFSWYRPLKWAMIASWALTLAAGAAYYWKFRSTVEILPAAGLTALLILSIYLTALRWIDRRELLSVASRIASELRVLNRAPASIATSLSGLPRSMVTSTAWPQDGLDDPRYEMLERLRRVVAPLGYRHIVVLIDRIDEPTLVSGDLDRMKSVVWPLLNNKLLQQGRIAFKLLLPLELRHEVYRQNAAFFQEARLDKQNMIDRLTWSGALLYDLCSARLEVCREPEAPSVLLTDLFEESVTRQDLVDSLDQMRQPRDAFKLMYQCIHDHCANTTEEASSWKIPRLILEQVRRAQVDRIEGLHRGVRPA